MYIKKIIIIFMTKYVKYFANVKTQLALYSLKKRIYTKIGTLSAEFVENNEPIPFEKKDGLNYRPITPGTLWSNKAYGCSWFHFKGEIPQSAQNKHVAFLISIGAEGCLVDSTTGTPIQGLATHYNLVDFVTSPAPGKQYIEHKQKAVAGEQIDMWIEGGNNRFKNELSPPKAIFKRADIVVVNDELKALYYDLVLLAMQIVITDKDTEKEKHASLKEAFKKALFLAKPYTSESILAARRAVKNEVLTGTPSEFTVYSTGHAHLDLAWLWPLRETQRKAGRTFANQLRNIQRYDSYIFGASQPQQFDWVEHKYPVLFKELSEQIAKGRIEVQGQMWVECDVNVTSGESIIRQCLYGSRYWEEKFDSGSKICWLPDCFGFNGNLPQFIKKCGMSYFLTIKMSWNEHNKFPKRTFIWEGIDGTQVLTHMPPEENYVSCATPVCLYGAVENYPEKDKVKVFSMLYGVGDGGGGPGERHIEAVNRETFYTGMPKVVHAPAIKLFEELEKVKDQLEVYKGELYLEKHQGTYTSQARNKTYNKKIETLIHNIEFIYSLSGEKYPYAKMEVIWKEILLYQFHDIIPGSSISRVYDESTARYEIIVDDLTKMLNQAISSISNDYQTPSAINATAFHLKDIVSYNNKYYQIDLPPYAASPMKEYTGEKVVSTAGPNLVESDKLVVKFSSTGEIVSLFNKKYKEEFAGEYLNRYAVYKDMSTKTNAWDINIDYTKQTPEQFKLIKTNMDESDPQIIRDSIYTYGKSTLNEKVIITAGKSYIEVVLLIDWQETGKMLRANFKPSIFSDIVTCDIQMGNITRSTKNETPQEKAQFEICAHKWVDVSKDNKGLSIFSESKYGWRVKEGLLSLNLLRSTMYPGIHADKGKHIIRFALYPHGQDVFNSNTAKYAYQFSNPPIIVDNETSFDSLVKSTEKNIVIETIKPSEDGTGIVVRVYEDSGKATRAKLICSMEYSKCYSTNMLEKDRTPVNIEQLIFNPYEIKTILIN
ncbi:MAG: glycosyl hydrolase-related protein [Christensenellaceae bacterium]|jgi:alpha-mannosidase|nr:glycosyl hydrolase-related protein [Christensenellaceae bacterium]